MRSIRRADEFEDMVRRLADEAHPDAGRSIFPSMRELMCFAAVLGFQEERRFKLEGKKTHEIDYRIWQNNDLALDLLYLIPLAAERNLNLLRPETEDLLVEVFEEFANGGLEIMQSWLNETPDDPHGDRALLNALHKHGYLSVPKKVDAVIDQIKF